MYETDELQRRPIPEMWSIAEYTDHVREVLFAMRFVLAAPSTRPAPSSVTHPSPSSRLYLAPSICIQRCPAPIARRGRSGIALSS